MEFIRIKSEKNEYFNETWELYLSSFPTYEIRRKEEHLKALKDENFFPMVVIEKGKFIGFIFYWKWTNYRYVEHFSIKSELRGKNYGTKVLKEICSEGDNIILEIDPPVDTISIKRFDFYNKAGFKFNNYKYFHPAYKLDAKKHELKIMSYPNTLNNEEYVNFEKNLKNKSLIYSEKVLEKI